MKKHHQKNKNKITFSEVKKPDKEPSDNNSSFVKHDLLKTFQLGFVLFLLAIFFYYAMLKGVSLFEFTKILK